MLQPPNLPKIDLPHAPMAVDGAQWVNTRQAYEAMLDALASASWVGIDTEFVRERTYFPAPGLVQISDGHHIWLVDVVTLKDHTPLKKLITEMPVPKVLHSVGEDLEILSLLTGNYPSKLIDTQIASALLGFPLQMRYEHLVEAVFEVVLPGGQARSNWCQRPLSQQLLSYAAQDVIYLPSLAEVLLNQLDRMGRLAWLHEDCQRLMTQKDTPFDPLLRVKGVGRLSKTAMAYVASLARWRDDEARRRNLPRSFVVKDEVLLAMGSRAETSNPAQAVVELKAQLKRFQDPCLQIMEKTDLDAFVIPSTLLPLTGEQRQQLKLWQTQMNTLAQSLNIDPALIASKKELARLMRGETPDWLKGWRGPLVKEALGLL